MRVALTLLAAVLAPVSLAQELLPEEAPPASAANAEPVPLVLKSAANPPLESLTVDEAVTRLRDEMREIADAALTEAEKREAFHELYERARSLGGASTEYQERPTTAEEAIARLERLFFEVALENAPDEESREQLLEGVPEHLRLEPVQPSTARRKPVFILRDPVAEGNWWGNAKFDAEALALEEILESPEQEPPPPEDSEPEPEEKETAVAVEVLADEKTTVEMHDNATILREIASDDGDLVLFDALHFWAGGAVQYDAYNYSDLFNARNGGSSEDSTATRRAEVIVRATLLDLGEVRLQYDVDSEFWRDLYYRIANPDKNFVLTIGNQNETISQESLLGNKFNAAMEQSAPTSTFASYRGAGVSVARWFAKKEGEAFLGLVSPSETAITTAFGIYGQDIENTTDTDLAATGRITWGRLRQQGDGLHLGLSGTYRDGEFDRINPRPELAEADRIVLARFDADRAAVLGFEALYTKGSLHASSEFYLADYSGGDIDAQGYGGFAEVGYYLTGQERTYRPQWGLWAPLQVGARNIFEVFGRFSYTYGNSDAQASNDLGVITVGGSWYRHKFRTSINLLYSATENDVNGEDDGFAASLRVQYLF